MSDTITLVDTHRQAPLQVLGVAVDVLADSALTGGQYTAYRCTVPPQVGPPPHYHAGFDEAFYVVSGTFEILVGSNVHRAEAGSFIFIPRGVVHTFRNMGESDAQFLGTATPGGHETFFTDADDLVKAGPMTLEGILEICGRNGIEVVA